MNTLDALLSNTYTADIKGHRAAAVADMKVAILADAILATAARERLTELSALITARGQQACAYSTKYWEYLTEALA